MGLYINEQSAVKITPRMRYPRVAIIGHTVKAPKRLAHSRSSDIRHQANVLGTMLQSSILLVQLKLRLPIIAPPVDANRLRLNPQLQPPLRLYSFHLQFLDERLAPESTSTDLSAGATVTG